MIIASHVVQQNPQCICPSEIYQSIVGISVPFLRFEGSRDRGILEIHRDLVDEVDELFWFMLTIRFPLSFAQPVSLFGWNDEWSMSANNTSGFNYRTIAGKSKLSQHAFGRAIDINPFLNPCVINGMVRPAGARYFPSERGTLTADSPVVLFLKRRGWTWGGDWISLQDYQHFEKPFLA